MRPQFVIVAAGLGVISLCSAAEKLNRLFWGNLPIREVIPMMVFGMMGLYFCWLSYSKCCRVEGDH